MGNMISRGRRANRGSFLASVFRRSRYTSETLNQGKVARLGFKVLGGVSVQQARTLVDAMNEKIVGVVVSSKRQY